MLPIKAFKNLLIPHVSPTNVCVFDLLLTECKRVFVERVACVFVFSFFFIEIVSKQFFTMTTKTGYQNSPYAPLRHTNIAELANLLDGNARMVALNASVIRTCTVLDGNGSSECDIIKRSQNANHVWRFSY
jgi:hypothetical protein